MKRFVLSLIAWCVMSGAVYAQDINLPAPFADSKGNAAALHQLLQGRCSVLLNSSFITKPIAAQDIASILWAASGLNRPERGWVVPVAYGNVPSPYWRVYLLNNEGVFLYKWAENKLRQIYNADVRGKIFAQTQPVTAPAVLVFVEDSLLIEEIAYMTSNRYSKLDIGAIAMGAVSQNIYLATEALNIHTRFMATINEDVARPYFELQENDKFLGYMPLWYKN